jgi:hypothetical protein
MPDVIGRITVPEQTASETFPLVTEYPHGRAQKRTVVVHQFGSANAKIEQRYFIGDGNQRFTFRRNVLKNSSRATLRNFWEARKGPNEPFFYRVPQENGGTVTHTVCFENAPLTFDDLTNAICSTGITLVDLPDSSSAPSYTITETVTRFPSSTLATNLLSQVQEIIPLVRIRVLDTAVPDIYLSDRRVTVGEQLYLPRLLRVGEQGSEVLMSQSIDGSADDVTLAFGNADRVMVQVANDTQLRWGRVELFLFRVDSATAGTLLKLWAGHLIDWHSDTGPEFTVKASDILSALTLSSPVGPISRQCWRRLGHDGCPFNPASDTRDLVHFPSASLSVCDLGYNTPNGCMAHGAIQSYGATYCAPQGVLLRSGGIGLTLHGFLPVVGGIVGTFVGSVSTWYPRTSIIADSIYGGTLPEIWHNDDGYPQLGLPVACKIAAGRDEDQFYDALGIVGRGPIGAFTAPQMWDSNGDGTPDTFLGSTLDGQMNHGFQVDSNGHLKSGANAAFGLRQVLGADPAGAHDYFSLGRVDAGSAPKGWYTQASDGALMNEVHYPWGPSGSAYNQVFAAGVAFCEIRRVKPNNDPLTAPGQHSMMAMVSQGLTAHAWTAPGSRYEIPGCTNPFWVTINTFLRAVGAGSLDASTQEQYFDTASAIAASNVADAIALRVIGTGVETQFRFKGSIDGSKPTRDWLQAILTNALGYFTWSCGKLKVGCRVNASALSAFTPGNMLFGSLQLEPFKPTFEKITAQFGDQEYQYQSNTVDYVDQEYAGRNNRVQNPLVRTLPLSGCATKSQAGRIGAVRTREELGGVNQAEQDAARIASWKSTILALDTEAGMVVSVADADLPGGSMNVRIERWTLNRDWSIAFTGKTVTASMYDLTVGPKPADVQAAPIPVEPVRDSDLPGQPTFAVGVSALDSASAEISGLTFVDPTNTDTISTARFTVYYVDEANGPAATLTADLTADAISATLTDETHFAEGDYALIDGELILLGTQTGATFAITRSQIGSSVDIHYSASATVLKVLQQVVTVNFPFAFFSSADAASWLTAVYLPNLKLAAVAAVATNIYGNSPAGTVCLTANADHGLHLEALAPGTAAARIVNVVNADATLSAGWQVVYVTATTRACTITMPPESADVGIPVTIVRAVGSTHDVNAVAGTGDTLSGASDPVVLSQPGEARTWTGA